MIWMQCSDLSGRGGARVVIFASSRESRTAPLSLPHRSFALCGFCRHFHYSRRSFPRSTSRKAGDQGSKCVMSRRAARSTRPNRVQRPQYNGHPTHPLRPHLYKPSQHLRRHR